MRRGGRAALRSTPRARRSARELLQAQGEFDFDEGRLRRALGGEAQGG